MDKTIEELRKESFQFSPARRTIVPQSGKKDLRSVDIEKVKDKLILEAMRIILEAIFEPAFLKSSHGFRPGKSYHTALKDIKVMFRGTKWFLEGDISKDCNSIDHNILIGLIRKRVKDERFLNLIRKALNAGYYLFKENKSDIIGIPQGNIISPILSNIYLHEFDLFMTEKAKAFDDDLPLFIKETIKKRTLSKKKDIKANESEEHISTNDYNDASYSSCNYVRYAGTWLVGIVGRRSDVEKLKFEIKEFFEKELKLILSEDKALIKKASVEKAQFLGMEISSQIYEEDKVVKITRENLRCISRKSNIKIRMDMPLKRVIDKLKTMYFCDGGGNPIPKFTWMGKSHGDIIKSYNEVIQGYLNYYGFVENMSALARVHYILKSSAAKLLAAKFKLKTQKAVYTKFGHDLTSPDNHSLIRRDELNKK